MATDALPQNNQQHVGDQRFAADRPGHDDSIAMVLRRVLTPLSSLRLTVVLLALAIVLVFIGTLAQATEDVWKVVSHYFRSWFAFVPWQVLFPPSFFPELAKDPFPANRGFWIPGGFTLGGLMAVNLMAAHGLRFKIQAQGKRLWSGVGVIVLGVVLGAIVVATQQDSESLTVIVSEQWNLLWTAVTAGVGLAWAACAYRLFAVPVERSWERWSWAAVGLGCGGLFCWLLVQWYNGDGAPIGGSSTRILWQLIKATTVGLVLLAGSIMVFRKRGGMVLLHAGIGLLMINELVVYGLHVETQTTIFEGESKNWTQDTRDVELTIIDRTDPAQDRVINIPRSLLVVGSPTQTEYSEFDLKSLLNDGPRVSDERLPFDIQLNQFIPNTRIHDADKTDANPATHGVGLDYVAREVRKGTGTDVGGEVDRPSAYITLYEKGTDRKLSSHLVSTSIDDGVAIVEMPNDRENPFEGRSVAPERVKIGQQKFDLVLRYQRYYLPYSIELKDFRKVDYPGTTTPRIFSSDLVIRDVELNVNREVHISMNNPYRYRGRTMYQSGFTPGQKGTILQIVSNDGWMVPYLALMIVAVGMLAHFMITLLRFLQRHGDVPQVVLVAESVDRGNQGAASPPRALTRAELLRAKPGTTPRSPETAIRAESAPRLSGPTASPLARWFPMLLVVLAGLYLASKARVPGNEPTEMDLNAFARLPVLEGGRIKPFDTLARQSLTQISDRQTYIDADGERQPAVRWLLDVITETDISEKHKVVRIHNTDVLAILNIEPAEGSRYSLEQIAKNADKFEAEVESIRAKNQKGGSAYEKKLLDVDRRLGIVRRLRASFMKARAEEFMRQPEARQKPERALRALQSLFTDLKRKELPLSVPGNADEPWLPYSIASDGVFRMLNESLEFREPTEPTKLLSSIFDAYAANNASDFNRAVSKYQSYLDGNPPSQLAGAWNKFETFFNHFEPFYYASVLYVLAFVLGALAWLGWTGPLNKAAFWLVVFTFAFHTVALIGRIVISGRPPVTNLYSSAIFIAWGCVGLGLILEMVYRLGLGTIVAAIAGFSSLLIAHLLATTVPGHNGDTIAVMQAVLDTQFWLATHVVCITLGYSTTFVAGIFGMMYVVKGLMTKSLTASMSKDLARMIYGTLCFAIFFSFFGTVLGGLWADDSWGRFWGWDPKENGALIIVLWNALILHARWGGMVKERGLAVLAIGGNIVTAWSWFGVNELGIGMHSYGFTEGVLIVLGGFVVSQMVFMALGSLPKQLWASFRTSPNT